MSLKCSVYCEELDLQVYLDESQQTSRRKNEIHDHFTAMSTRDMYSALIDDHKKVDCLVPILNDIVVRIYISY